MVKIFLSHSSKDALLVRSLMDMLQTQFNLQRDNFFLTSDNELEVGSNWIETIRSEMNEASIVLPLITPNFLESQFCLCELGASWVNEKGLVPVIIPPLNHSALKNTPYNSWIQTLTLNSIDDLSKLAQAMVDRDVGKVNLPRFNARAETFFNEIVIPYKNQMESRLVVTVTEVERLMQELEEHKKALKEVENEAENYRKENIEIRRMKDTEEIKKFDYQKMGEWEKLEEKSNELKTLLKKLPKLMPSIIFHFYKESRKNDGNDGFYSYSENGDLKKLSNEGFILCEEGWEPNDEHPRVAKVNHAIENLQFFMENVKDDKITTRFEEEYEDIIFDLTYSSFWEKVLGVTIYHSDR